MTALAEAHAVRADDLVVRGLCKAYEGGAPVLSGIEFAIPSGQSVALIGANGAGKSTLLRCCMHLIQPDQGQVHLLGHDLADLKPGALRHMRSRVGFVFQKHNLVPRLSAVSNVLHGAIARSPFARSWLQGLASGALREEAMRCLARVGLAHLAARRVDKLSGGQSQRVAIARALMQGPRMMVADEPVASLDPSSGEEVMSLFANLFARRGSPCCSRHTTCRTPSTMPTGSLPCATAWSPWTRRLPN
jgi:phosphonate transport system ATP-binding protein